MSSFYFPNLSKCITDPKIKDFIQGINNELLTTDQESHVIKLLVEKAKFFFVNNFDVVEELLETLKAEEMLEAVM